MRNFSGQSNAAQITRTFTVIILLIILLTGVSIAGVVGYRLTKNRMDDAQILITSLKRSFIDDAPDWQQWKMNSPINTKDTYVKVSTKISHQKHQIFYSPNARKFLHAKEWQVPGFNNIRYRNGFGFFYRSGAESRHIYYETWTSLHDVIHIFRLILEDLLLVIIIGGILGYLITAWLARRLNRPLAALTNAAAQINHAENISYHEALPVPIEPTEVHDLGVEINQLLQSLNKQVLRDHQFVADASHELRTPLTAIRGHISLINRRGKEHPEVISRSLKFIDHESIRMQTLVENLLQLTRMDHTEATLSYQSVDKVIRETVTNYETSLPQTITMALTPTNAYFNSANLQQILLALLSNASKYSPESGTVQVTVAIQNDQPTITIADQGIGISDVDKSHVFERFYRVDQARSQAIPGTGLGLAIVARLAELNQAQISVSDNLPHGTIFTIHLARQLK